MFVHHIHRFSKPLNYIYCLTSTALPPEPAYWCHSLQVSPPQSLSLGMPDLPRHIERFPHFSILAYQGFGRFSLRLQTPHPSVGGGGQLGKTQLLSFLPALAKRWGGGGGSPDHPPPPGGCRTTPSPCPSCWTLPQGSLKLTFIIVTQALPHFKLYWRLYL